MLSRLLAALRFYRVVNWSGKIGWGRWLGYLLLGYALAGRWEAPLAFANLAGMAGLFMFTFSIDDYFDWQHEDDHNFLRAQVEAGALTSRQALWLCVLPLAAALPLLARLPAQALGLALAFLFVAGFHSMPPLRFKRSAAAAFLSSPVCAAIVFLEGAAIGGTFRTGVLPLAVLLCAFHGYMDLFHETGYRIQGERKGAVRMLGLLKRFPAVPFVISLAFSLSSAVFLISAASWLVRARALRQVGLATDFHRFRQAVLSPVWFLPEFAAYAVLAQWRGL